MKNQLFIAGSIALALAAGVMFLPSLSDAATRNRGGGGAVTAADFTLEAAMAADFRAAAAPGEFTPAAAAGKAAADTAAGTTAAGGAAVITPTAVRYR